MSTSVRTRLSPASATTRGGAERGFVLRIARARAGLELTQFFRDRAQLVLTFSMPVIMMALFGVVFGASTAPGSGVDTRPVFATGMLAIGVMSTSFQSLALQVAQERSNGALKRLRGLPMPAVSYFMGKVVLVLVSSLGQAAALLGVGAVLFGVRLPADAGRWVTLGWVYGLGVVACTLLGLAYSSLVSGPRAGVVVFVPFMILQFTSGAYVPFTQLPEWVQSIAALFPLKWLCQGMRSVFLPDGFAAAEPGGGWEHGHVALILAAWAVLGLVLCLRTFRWRASD